MKTVDDPQDCRQKEVVAPAVADTYGRPFSGRRTTPSPRGDGVNST